MDALISALAALYESQRPLNGSRECDEFDTQGAPESVLRLLAAMRAHEWPMNLGDVDLASVPYIKDGVTHHDPLRTLEQALEVATHFDGAGPTLAEHFSRAGADGGPLIAARTLQLGAWQQSWLGVNWSHGSAGLCLVDLSVPPQQPGQVLHYLTPGAFFSDCEDYFHVDFNELEPLRAACSAAGESIERDEPAKSPPYAPRA